MSFAYTEDEGGVSRPAHLRGSPVAQPDGGDLIRGWALIGGLILVALMLETAASAASNLFFNKPFEGDYELMKHFVAVAVFCFLPYCQLTGANVTVDIFTENASERAKAAMLAFSSLFAIVFAVLMLRQMSLGFVSYIQYPETTATLHIPLWTAFPPALFSLALLFIAAVITLIQGMRGMPPSGSGRLDGRGRGTMEASFLIGLAGLIALLALIVVRVPIAYTMILVGVIGTSIESGPDVVLYQLKDLAYAQFSNYDLSVLPMFILMGSLAARSGLSRDLFRGANAWFGRFRGGVAMAAVAACGGFGAVCGSSTATASTMGIVALPELRRYNYAPSLATGTIAAGGTLGILIPPSVVLIVYAIIVEANIVTLFEAALLPGPAGRRHVPGDGGDLCAAGARRRPEGRGGVARRVRHRHARP